MKPRSDEYDAIVVGLGQTGYASARFLAGRGMRIAICDTRSTPPFADEVRQQLPGVELFTGPLETHPLNHSRQLVISPGISCREPAIMDAVERGAEVVGDIELFAQNLSRPVIAITGSNGKSTVTRLVESLARSAGIDAIAAGNIGKPVLDLLSDEDTGRDLYVLELSSFQLETTNSLKPSVATILNISPDHMDRYPTRELYSQAKHRVYRNARVAVYNRDDLETTPVGRYWRTISFGLDAPGESDQYGLLGRRGETWLARGDTELLAASELTLLGRHNWLNVLAALALLDAYELDVSSCLEAARAFKGLEHRMEVVAVVDGVTFVNDSKATNVGAAVSALRGAGAPVILVAGGQGKGADFSPLAAVVAEHARAVIVFGEDGHRIKACTESVVDTVAVSDLESALQLARERSQPGDTVLFAPACASFDMFENFERRGEAFRRLVRKLK